MKKNVTYSLEESEIKKLKELAKREKRSQSNMIAVLINKQNWNGKKYRLHEIS